MTQQEERADSARMSQVSGSYPNEFTPMHQRSISINAPHHDHSTMNAGAGHHQNSGEAPLGERSGSDMNQSVLGRISSSFQIFSTKMTNKIGEALGFYGRPVADYAKAVKDLFNECYFLEQWIRELMVMTHKRSSEEETLLTKLSRISKFLQE